MAILKDNTNGTTIEGRNFRISELSEGDLGEFQAIGRINHMGTKHEQEKLDIFDALNKVSKSAYSVFNDIKNNRTWYTNIAFVSMEDMTESQKVMLRSRLKELRDADIIRKARTTNERYKVKRGSYMINPYLLKCYRHQEEVEAVWRLLK